MKDYSNYLSTFSWRYGSKQMRQLFSLDNKFRTWRRVWVALARVQQKYGLLTKAELEDITKHESDVSIDEIFEIEKSIHHDVVAGITEFSRKAKIGGGKIHLGATSMDIVDNSESFSLKEALMLIESKIHSVLKGLALLITKYADTATLGFTHLQPAEPTTVGYRLSFYAQDLLLDLDYLDFLKKVFRAKGIKGAVGTSASFKNLLPQKSQEIEAKVMEELGLKPFLITSQVATRKLDYLLLTFLASLCSSVAKFAEDLRILQSPTIGEWSEPFARSQVGSSAMPFKKNPVSSEKICSLARYVAQLPNIAWGNATLSHLERTLDDSANKRIIMPEAFLATDEILITFYKILSGLIINVEKININLETYTPFIAIEIILAQAVKKGAHRQALHEHLKSLSLKCWRHIAKGKTNPLKQSLLKDKLLQKYLNKSELTKCLYIKDHLGDAPARAKLLVKIINNRVKNK